MEEGYLGHAVSAFTADTQPLLRGFIVHILTTPFLAYGFLFFLSTPSFQKGCHLPSSLGRKPEPKLSWKKPRFSGTLLTHPLDQPWASLEMSRYVGKPSSSYFKLEFSVTYPDRIPFLSLHGCLPVRSSGLEGCGRWCQEQLPADRCRIFYRIMTILQLHFPICLSLWLLTQHPLSLDVFLLWFPMKGKPNTSTRKGANVRTDAYSLRGPDRKLSQSNSHME